jgi:uncharacterized protein (TIGR00299 family) protein
MKIAHFDAFSGIAGDMTVAALIDAGASAETLFAGLDSLGTGARFSIEKVKRRGIAGTKLHIEYEDPKKHRHLPAIVKMIEASALPPRARERAVRVFQVLGEAEAAVHAVPIEKVHFHEVGAIDSICDIAGACYALELLGIDRVTCSAINTGSGTVEADHGVMPVPTPATALLLKDKPVYASGPATELTTPTGAALMAALASHFGPMPALRLEATGFGAGTKDFPGMANLVRVLIGEDSGAPESTSVSVIEANIDDATPELLAWAMERLLQAGALDVTLQPVFMKKGRAATCLQVIATKEQQETLAALLLRETTTLGLRIFTAERRVLAREWHAVGTPFGEVRVKVAGATASPEFADCAKLAGEAGVPLKTVMTAALAAWNAQSAESKS